MSNYSKISLGLIAMLIGVFMIARYRAANLEEDFRKSAIEKYESKPKSKPEPTVEQVESNKFDNTSGRIYRTLVIGGTANVDNLFDELEFYKEQGNDRQQLVIDSLNELRVRSKSQKNLLRDELGKMSKQFRKIESKTSRSTVWVRRGIEDVNSRGFLGLLIAKEAGGIPAYIFAVSPTRLLSVTDLQLKIDGRQANYYGALNTLASTNGFEYVYMPRAQSSAFIAKLREASSVKVKLTSASSDVEVLDASVKQLKAISDTWKFYEALELYERRHGEFKK